MIYSLDLWIKCHLAAKAQAEIFALVEELQVTDSELLERFELRGKPCGPVKIRLSTRNQKQGSEHPSADYGDWRLWQRSPLCESLPYTTELLESFPLENMARILVLIDPAGWGTPIHRDHQLREVTQEFVWFRTSFDKLLYVLDDQGNRTEVEGLAAWFDSRHRHGVESSTRSTISIRVDGRFLHPLRAALAAQKRVPSLPA